MSRIIAISNNKGGVGKTTTAVNLAVALSQIGKKILLIDMDPQANLTNILLCAQPDETIADVLQKPNKKLGIYSISEKLDLVASSIKLSKIDDYLNDKNRKEYTLKKILARYTEQYDFILLDCPPALSLLTINALVVANEVFVTITPEALSIQGLNSLNSLIDAIKIQYNSRLRLSGLLITRYNARKKINKAISALMAQRYGKILFKTKIRENVAITESQLYHKDVISFSPMSNGAIDYKELAKEVAEM